MESLRRYLTLAVRTLYRTPAYTLTTTLTLALGVGAVAATLAVIDTVLFRPLAFPDSDRLVRVLQEDEVQSRIAPVRLAEWRRFSNVFDALSGYYTEDASDTTDVLPVTIRRAVVTTDFFKTWGVSPAIGRAFLDEEYSDGASNVIVVSDRYWRTRLDADPAVAGRRVRIAGKPFTVVGVMPASFEFPVRDVDMWWPKAADPEAALKRDLQWYVGVGRMKPGVTTTRAIADLSLVQRRLAAEHPDTDGSIGVVVDPLKEIVVGGSGESLWLLLGAASLLLVACTNVSAMMLTRVADRGRQIAVRRALGASRRSVAMQTVAEVIVLIGMSTVLALLVSKGAIAIIISIAPELPRLARLQGGADVILYVLLIQTLAAVLCALLPTMRSARSAWSLDSSRSQVSGRHRLQWTLVAVQVVLSVSLMVGAGLLVRSFEALSRVEPGFDLNNVLVFRLTGNWAEEDDRPALVARIDRTLDAVRSVPGVESAATAWTLPGVPTNYVVEFLSTDGGLGGGEPMGAEWRTVSPSCFNLARIPHVAGESCRMPASADGIRSVMVNKSFADRFLPVGTGIGRQLTWEAGTLTGRISGIVGDAREAGVNRVPNPTVYVCDNAPSPFPWYMVRTHGEPLAVLASLRARMKEVEPLRSVHSTDRLSDRIEGAFAEDRLRMKLLIGLAVAALALTCLGVYGTLGYAISLRRREIGLRMALGATAGRTARYFIQTTMAVVGIAVAVGILLAALLARPLSSRLYDVSVWDPVTFVGVALLVLLAALFGALIPVLRAARVAPTVALMDK